MFTWVLASGCGSLRLTFFLLISGNVWHRAPRSRRSLGSLYKGSVLLSPETTLMGDCHRKAHWFPVSFYTISYQLPIAGSSPIAWRTCNDCCDCFMYPLSLALPALGKHRSCTLLVCVILCDDMRFGTARTRVCLCGFVHVSMSRTVSRFMHTNWKRRMRPTSRDPNPETMLR